MRNYAYILGTSIELLQSGKLDYRDFNDMSVLYASLQLGITLFDEDYYVDRISQLDHLLEE